MMVINNILHLNAIKFFSKALLCVMLIISSCTSSQHVLLDHSDVKSPKIDIYLKGIQRPARDFEMIAYIESTGSVFTKQKRLMRELKRNAEKLGGNAVTEVNFFYIPWAFSSLPAIEGVVIKYK